MRPTLSDIAREADVSAATVDRVLNDRAGVRPRTRDRVLAAARRIGYLEADPAQAPGPVRLHFLLPEGTNAAMRALADQVRLHSGQMAGVEAVIETIAIFDPPLLSDRLASLAGNTDGIALIAVDHPVVRAALRTLADARCPVVTLVTDILGAPRLAYVGVDNSQAGRLAGYLVGRFLGRSAPAKVAFFAGSLAYRGHQEREMGFRQILTEDFGHIDLVERREVHEDRDKAHRETLALIDRHPDLAAIYNAGGATFGIARALKERGLEKKVVFVAHEATEGNKALLLDGTLDAVVDQNTNIAVREALQLLAAEARQTSHISLPPTLQVIFRENLPAS